MKIHEVRVSALKTGRFAVLILEDSDKPASQNIWFLNGELASSTKATNFESKEVAEAAADLFLIRVKTQTWIRKMINEIKLRDNDLSISRS